MIRFGASTRSYTLREKPTGSSKGEKDIGDENEENNQAGLLGLPESDTELDVSHGTILISKCSGCQFQNNWLLGTLPCCLNAYMLPNIYATISQAG